MNCKIPIILLCLSVPVIFIGLTYLFGTPSETYWIDDRTDARNTSSELRCRNSNKVLFYLVDWNCDIAPVNKPHQEVCDEIGNKGHVIFGVGIRKSWNSLDEAKKELDAQLPLLRNDPKYADYFKCPDIDQEAK